MLRNFEIDSKYKVLDSSSLVGSQEKYFKDNMWFKINRVGNEGLAEELISIVLKHSNITNYVEYKQCSINERKGCYSSSFLLTDEKFVPLSTLYKYATGGDLTSKIFSIPEVPERFLWLVNFCKDVTHLDLSRYLANILTLDMLTLNIDRHLSNLGVITTTYGYREAPIFDNGQALFQNYSIFNPSDTYELNKSKATANTFCGSFEKQWRAVMENTKPTLKIKYNELLFELNRFEKSQALLCLLHQLQLYESLLAD